MQHHPDRNPHDKDCEHRFKEVNEAYDVLKDGEKRAAYDRFGHAAFDGGMGGGGGPGGMGAGGRFGGGGGGGGRRQRQASGRGADLRTSVEISLEEGFAGAKKTISVPSSVSCDACSGTGSEGGTASATTCTTCQGVGK